MQKFVALMAMERVKEARAKWSAANREFQQGLDKVMGVLLHEAARNYMSPNDVAKATGMTRLQITRAMTHYGLRPSEGKRLLSEKAAKALAENAELLGVDVHEIDLTSPLAYLPMGNQLRNELQSKAVQGVTELDEFPETDDVRVQCPSCGYEHYVTLA